MLEGRLLDISTASSRSTLNEIFKVLAENDMIESIDVKENHLKEVFMKG